jgi:hypothetical protein
MWTVFVVCLSFVHSASAEDAVPTKSGHLFVGWGHRDVTPQQPVNLAGQFHTRITKEVASPVTVTALAIETRDGDQSLDQGILISCDVVIITDSMQPKLRKLLEGKLPGFDLRKVLLHATHTHSAPDIGAFEYEIPPEVMSASQYVDFFLSRAAEAAIEAWEKRRPGGMNFGMGYAVVGYNRRMTYADGTAAMYGANNSAKFRGVEGYEDHAVECLFFYDADKKLTGVTVNVACPSQVLENTSKISADFWHDVREVLREKYSKDLNVLALCGAAGDQSPHPQMRKEAEKRMRVAQGNLSETRAIALRIRDAVDSAYQATKDNATTQLPFTHHVETLRLPGRKITDNEFRSAKALCAQLKVKAEGPNNATGRAFLRWHSAIMERFEKEAQYAHFDVELHVLVLGNIAIASNPFELFIDYGIQMKTRSKAVQTFVMQLSGGWGGYLPTPRAVAGGGYSAIAESGLVGPEGGQMLVDRTVELINKMLKK